MADVQRNQLDYQLANAFSLQPATLGPVSPYYCQLSVDSLFAERLKRSLALMTWRTARFRRIADATLHSIGDYFPRNPLRYLGCNPVGPIGITQNSAHMAKEAPCWNLEEI